MFIFRQLVLLGALLTALPVESLPVEPTDAPVETAGSIALGSAEFPHSMHAVDLEIECVSCHHETNAEALDIPHPEYFDDFWIECQTCHRGGSEPAVPQHCSACHHSSPTTIADETLSAKVVIHETCFSCHEAGTGANASRGCSNCHRSRILSEEKGDARG